MFEMAWHMIGMEKFMIDMSSGEEYVGVLLDKMHRVQHRRRQEAGRAGCGRYLGRRRLWRAERHVDLAAHVARCFKPRLAERLAASSSASTLTC